VFGEKWKTVTCCQRAYPVQKPVSDLAKPLCRQRGGMGHIPDGVFNFVGNTIQILSAPQRTVNELSRLAQIIREAREKKGKRPRK
jgi:hypothetical protein